MALIGQGASLRPNSRSHTSLVASPGDAPNVEYIVDPSLPGLFEYPYAANRRFSKVVIPKGTIVATGPAVRDYLTLKYRNIVTFADETKNPVGVAFTSYFRRFKKDENGVEVIAHDEFGGDDFQPTFITRDLVEVPYLPNPADVWTQEVDATPSPFSYNAVNGMKFMWGCATNSNYDDIGTANELKAGDYVKAGKYGKFIKWVKGTDDPVDRVGQVLELKTDLPPLGWLKMVEPVYEGKDSIREEFTPEPAPADGSMVYDPNFKWPLTRDYKSPGAWKTIGGGFKGFTDAAQISLTTRIQRFSPGAGKTEIKCALDPVVKVDGTTLSIYIDGSEISSDTEDATHYVYSPVTQIATITLESAAVGTEVIEITYKVDVDSLIGTPPAWDYVGSVGAVSILLQR